MTGYRVMMMMVMAMLFVPSPAETWLSLGGSDEAAAPRRESTGINTTFRVNSVNKDLFTRHSYVISSTNLPESEAPLIRYGGEQMRIEHCFPSRQSLPTQTILSLADCIGDDDKLTMKIINKNY